ncbi:hypothetical protein Pyn_28960 [Prunus yedoensis var. nudiflora]|uniref:EF-hand domain-containing protein n=1 Tax=Prunus yedoensis var. nudiflora TaxID=2094558 RepID=A0A314ZBW8_PRUYE|nr:hypothetical protein Pyn_28960 [Prunus yedoensis var. nudiflora]
MVFDPNHPKPATDVPYTEDLIMKLFKSHDKNGDDQLSKDELNAAFKQLGSKWPSIRASLAKHYADDNRDGFISIEKELSELVNGGARLGILGDYNHFRPIYDSGRGNEGGDFSVPLVSGKDEFEP